MESRAFHICPFCQAQCPVTATRCGHCDRALSGLPLPVYGTELDAEMRPDAGADLIDLPLRETTTEAPRPDVPRAAVPAVSAPPAPARRPSPGWDRRTARVAVSAGLMGAAGLLGAAVLVGTWLVRAQDREAPPATTPPLTTPSVTAPTVTAPRVTAAAPPRARPAPPPAVKRAAAPSVSEAAREETPAPRPRRPPAAEVIAGPDVAANPVDVERARDDLDRAEQRRDAAAERVRELRAQVNVPVVKDVAEYQRLQQELSAALDDLDQANVEVRRFRRALRGRAE